MHFGDSQIKMQHLTSFVTSNLHDFKRRYFEGQWGTNNTGSHWLSLLGKLSSFRCFIDLYKLGRNKFILKPISTMKQIIVNFFSQLGLCLFHNLSRNSERKRKKKSEFSDTQSLYLSIITFFFFSEIWFYILQFSCFSATE